MKFVIVLCVLTLVVLSAAKPETHSRGCIYIMGRCHREYPEGTHSYTTGCGQKTPEPTCDEPHPKKEEGIICDYSACYCDDPTVRDHVSGNCVTVDKCPKKL